MTETTINGEVYRTGKLTAMEQFHVVRRLLPVVSVLGELPSGSDIGFLQAMATAIGKLSDDDCDFIIAKCLTVCQRQQGGLAWVNVWNAAARKPQFDDIDLATMINLVTTTLSENLAGFFPALPQTSDQGNSPPNAR